MSNVWRPKQSHYAYLELLLQEKVMAVHIYWARKKCCYLAYQFNVNGKHFEQHLLSGKI